jgi:hypothetical protein
MSEAPLQRSHQLRGAPRCQLAGEESEPSGRRAACAGPIVRFARLPRPHGSVSADGSEHTNSWPEGAF